MLHSWHDCTPCAKNRFIDATLARPEDWTPTRGRSEHESLIYGEGLHKDLTFRMVKIPSDCLHKEVMRNWSREMKSTDQLQQPNPEKILFPYPAFKWQVMNISEILGINKFNSACRGILSSLLIIWIIPWYPKNYIQYLAAEISKPVYT